MLRVGFYQFYPRFGNVEHNRQKVIERLSRIKADILVLPELAFTGYNFMDRSELEPLAEDPSLSQTISDLSAVCAEKDMYIISGFAEKRGNRLFNSAILVGPPGLIDIYRKIQLFFREKEIFDPGDKPLTVHTIKGARVGMMICFDWIFPEISRTLALKGADIICHPSNLVLSYCQETMKTRCLENAVYAITANRFGAEKRPHGTLKFTGKSQITAPKGDLLYRAGSQKEELYITEIDPIQARDKKITELNDLFRDRRPAFYSDICHSG
jgi:predicted amidohydrolase